MPTALLAGAFGQGNLGDEALLQAFAAALPGWRLVATTSERAADVVGVPITELTDFEGVPARKPLAVAGKTCAADAVIVGGGTVFKLLDPGTGRRPRELLANASALVGSASLLRRPVAMIGVGAGWLEGPVAAAYARFLVRHSDLLILRDEESAEKLNAIGAAGPFRVGADPAWTLLGPPGPCHSRRSSRVLIVPSGDAAASVGGRDRLFILLVRTIELVRAAGLEVALQAFQCGQHPGADDDLQIVQNLERRVGPGVEVLATPTSLAEAVTPMRNFDSVLCFRFHSLVAAAAAGTPTVAFAHEAKLDGLARRFGQAAVRPPVSPRLLADAFVASADAPGPAPAVVKEEIERAEEGFRLLRIFLSGGSDEADRLGALPLIGWPK